MSYPACELTMWPFEPCSCWKTTPLNSLLQHSKLLRAFFRKMPSKKVAGSVRLVWKEFGRSTNTCCDWPCLWTWKLYGFVSLLLQLTMLLLPESALPMRENIFDIFAKFALVSTGFYELPKPQLRDYPSRCFCKCALTLIRLANWSPCVMCLLCNFAHFEIPNWKDEVVIVFFKISGSRTLCVFPKDDDHDFLLSCFCFAYPFMFSLQCLSHVSYGCSTRVEARSVCVANVQNEIFCDAWKLLNKASFGQTLQLITSAMIT